MHHPKGFVIRDHDPRWGTPEDTCLHIVLVAPEIPGNTGNVGRLCAGTSLWLHLVEPLGFELENKYLRRAGLDYWPHVKLAIHPDFGSIESIFSPDRLHLFSTHARHAYTDVRYRFGDALVFGRETKGLDKDLLARLDERTRLIPRTDKVRSLNLSNAVAIASYEAMRQLEWSPLQS